MPDLMNIDQAQQELQGRYSDYLKKKRDLQGVRDTAEQRFTGSFGPQGETGAIVNPADIFSSFRTFQSAVPSEADSLATESSILAQIAKLAEARQPEQLSPSDQISAYKAGVTFKDGRLVPGSSDAGIIDPETGEMDYSGLTGSKALSIVNKTGRRLLSGGLKEKTAQAEAILGYGSVEKYLKNAPLDDIYSLKAFKDEAANDEAGYNLLRRISEAQAYFEPNAKADFFGKGNLTGPIKSRMGMFRGKKAINAQSAIGELSAEKIKELSGAAVSEQEFERLKKFLPDAGMQENEIATNLDRLNRAVEMNLQAREDAVRSGLSVSQFWKQNGDKYLEKFGFTGEDNKSSANTKSVDTNSLVKKYW